MVPCAFFNPKGAYGAVVLVNLKLTVSLAD
jgi:hypothetical protein